MSLFVFLNNQRRFKNVKCWMSLAGCGGSLARRGLSLAYSLPALSQQRKASFPPSQRPSLKAQTLNSVRSERGAPVGEEILMSYN